MKRANITLAFLLVTIMAMAQNLRFGVTAGLNDNIAAGIANGGRLGWTAGGIMLYDLSSSDNSWYAGTTLVLTQKGYNSAAQTYQDNPSVYKSSTDMTYLQLSPVFGKNFRMGKDAKLFLETGPYLSLGLWGYYKQDKDGKKIDSDSKVYGDKGFNRFDWGWTFGLGVEMCKHLRLKVGYELGIPNLPKERNDGKEAWRPNYRNRNLTFTAAYIF